jgi:hypothetical protein
MVTQNIGVRGGGVARKLNKARRMFAVECDDLREFCRLVYSVLADLGCKLRAARSSC